jgi:adenylate cyclase
MAQASAGIFPPLLPGSLALQHGAMVTRVAATLLGLTGILVADATPNGPLANLRNWVFDAYERHWPTSRPPDQILVIDIDGDSIRRVGQWPWPRDELARLVKSRLRRGLSALTFCLQSPTGSRPAITTPMRSLPPVCIECLSSSLQPSTPLVNFLRFR